MVTTDQLIPIEAFGSEPPELAHLTGSFQMVARLRRDRPDGDSIQVDLRFDAARLRGVGLKTGARYWARGVHQSQYHFGELPAPFELVGRFELLGCGSDGSQSTQQTLTVRFKVIVPPDGRVSAAAAEVKLLSDSNRPY